jgi:hypothetical protein
VGTGSQINVEQGMVKISQAGNRRSTTKFALSLICGCALVFIGHEIDQLQYAEALVFRA